MNNKQLAIILKLIDKFLDKTGIALQNDLTNALMSDELVSINELRKTPGMIMLGETRELLNELISVIE